MLRPPLPKSSHRAVRTIHGHPAGVRVRIYGASSSTANCPECSTSRRSILQRRPCSAPAAQDHALKRMVARSQQTTVDAYFLYIRETQLGQHLHQTGAVGEPPRNII